MLIRIYHCLHKMILFHLFTALNKKINVSEIIRQFSELKPPNNRSEIISWLSYIKN